MFFLVLTRDPALTLRSSRYTPQAPTSLSNGPTIIEAQVETIADMIAKLESEKVQTFEPQRSAEVEWKATLEAMSKHTLIPFTDR